MDIISTENSYEPEILSPKIDCVFKLLFGDERHKKILKNFLRHAIILENDDLESVRIVGTELRQDYPGDKYGILDVAAKTRGGVQINIEIQLLYQSAMPKRTLYYWAKKYTEQLAAGQPYDALYRTVAINIVDFRMFEDNRHHHTFAVREKNTGELLSDVLEIHFMELKKLPSKATEDGLTDWLQFINAEEKGVMEMLAKKNEEIREAVDILETISHDKAVRDLYFSRQMAIHDSVTREKHALEKGIRIGEEKGLEKGIQIGEEKGFKNGVQIGEEIGIEAGQYDAGIKLVRNGMKLDDIAKILDLNEEKLRRLLDDSDVQE